MQLLKTLPVGSCFYLKEGCKWLLYSVQRSAGVVMLERWGTPVPMVTETTSVLTEARLAPLLVCTHLKLRTGGSPEFVESSSISEPLEGFPAKALGQHS